LFSSTVPRPALGSAQSPLQWVEEGFCPGLKRARLDADHSPQFSAEVKKFRRLEDHEVLCFTLEQTVNSYCKTHISSCVSLNFELPIPVFYLATSLEDKIIDDCVLTLRRLMSYIYIYIYICMYVYVYGTPILDVSRSHTTTQHSR